MDDPAAAPGSGPAGVAALYFDGRQARAHPVRLQRLGPVLRIAGETIEREVRLADLDWGEYQVNGIRQAELPDGAMLQASDDAGWEVLRAAAGWREALAVRASRSWIATLVAVFGVLVAAAAVWLWGVPAAATAAVKLVPPAIERSIGEQVGQSLRGDLLLPSRLSAAEQARIGAAFEAAVDRAFAPGQAPVWRLSFQRSRIGPNAFALPGGEIVMTDELVRLVQDEPAGIDMLVGVLAHELGHVRFRHGMRGVAQAGIASLAAAMVFGDVSSLVATAPALLLQLGYSRDFEREADLESVRILRAAGLSPAVMADFFERMARSGPGAKPGAGGGDPPAGKGLIDIALSSHPADAQRIRFFREAAGGSHADRRP